MPRHRRLPIPSLLSGLLLMVLALPSGVAAHSGVTVGPYELELGWRVEPAVAGAANGVQVTITRLDTGEPLNDLAAGDLVVTISSVGRDSSTLPLAPAFDAGTSAGVDGTYEAAYVPAVAGDYKLQVTGSIHGTAVDAGFENTVDGAAATSEQGPDAVVIVGGAAILVLLAGMAFLLFRVRSAPAPPS